jgi:hypothetical protein
MAENRLAGAAARAGSDLSGPPRDAPARPLLDGGIHLLPSDGRRFPICDSWRSNWKHTDDPDRATCPQCRARLASRSTLPPG